MGILLAAAVAAGVWRYENIEAVDVRTVYLGDREVVLETASAKRELLSEIRIAEGVKLWIPEGLGWYEAGKIKKLLEQEKKMDLVPQIMFFNFGFSADRVVTTEDQVGWRVPERKLNRKTETVAGKLADNEEMLNLVMVRDMADSRLLAEDIRVSVYNTGKSPGLAALATKMLERAGLTVVTVDNYPEMEETGCRIRWGVQAANDPILGQVMGLLGDCRQEAAGDLAAGEVVIYMGERYAQMINYDSYLEDNF